MNEKYFWQLYGCAARLKEQTDQLMQPFCTARGVTPARLKILLSLQMEGPQIVGELAKGSCMAGANASTLCKKLEAEGLVERRRLADDERQVQVQLTGAGRALAREILGQYEEAANALRQRLSEEEERQIAQALHTLAKAMQAEPAKSGPMAGKSAKWRAVEPNGASAPMNGAEGDRA